MAGRGRGRGRGGPSGQIVRDDDGNILEAAGPPPMFPDIAVPGRVDNDDRMERLRLEQKRLRDFWRASAYNLNAKNTAVEVKPHLKVERWADRNPQQQDNSRLRQATTLDPAYFPQELYSKQDKRISDKLSTASGQRAFWENINRNPHTVDDADKILELLAERAKRGEDGGNTSPRPKGKKEDGEEGDDDEEEVEVDDEGDEFEEDDYLQGAHVDDDEGYEDPYADDDGGEALF